MAKRKNMKNKYLQSPYLEIIIMVSSIALAYFGLAVLSMVPQVPTEGAMSTASISLVIFAFFLLSVAIALISVIAGIGGGVIFTPLMLAFTGIDSLVVRGTGLIVAMFSGLISTGIFLKKGIGNYKLCMTLTLSQSVGALIGATLAVKAAKNAGALSEGWMRTSLGVLLALIAVYLFLGGKKLEWPVIKKVDRFTDWLKLGGSYYEESEGQQKTYGVTRAPLGILLLFFIGMIGGFYGMGGGWAITPTLNMAMGLPLKLAAANSHIILGIGSCVSIWPYVNAGSIIPLFVLPWLSGQVIGGFIASHIFAKIRVKVVRLILIGIMVFTAFTLITKGLNILNIMGEISALAQVIIFTAILACVIAVVMINNKKDASNIKPQNGDTLTKPLSIPETSLPASIRVYANITHWIMLVVSVAALFIPVFVLANPANNLLNPNTIFGAIFNGATPNEIWGTSVFGAFPGMNAFILNLTKTDSWAMLIVNIGCAVGLIAVIPAVMIQFFKEKERLSACLGTVMIGLIICAMIGVI
ncbi:MAG: sulfite exporter TauE/SafE family protein [Petrimonas sp.]|nr:sulfite exporter TauE/SafE family protein [Petrimonas sp.]